MPIVQDNMARVVDRLMYSGKLFNTLTECMSLQPDLDPEAGYGPFQIPTLLDSSKIMNSDSLALLERLGNDTVLFYLIIRSIWAGSIIAEDVITFARDNIKIDLHKIMSDTTDFIPSLKRSVFEEHVTRFLNDQGRHSGDTECADS